MERKIIGIPAKKMVNLLAALLCAAICLMFIYLSLNNSILKSGHAFFIGGVTFLQYTVIGVGFVFLVVSVFFIREAFRDGFFTPESMWEDGMIFCKAMILLWLILFCFDFLLPLIRMAFVSLFIKFG